MKGPTLLVSLCLLSAMGSTTFGLEPPSEKPAAISPASGNASLTLLARHLRGIPGEVASRLLRPEVGGPLAVEINAQAIWQGGERATVFYQLEIDGASLLDQGQGARGRVEVYLYVLSDALKLADFTAQAFVIDHQQLGEAIWQSGLRFQGELTLGPGTYRLRCLVRESSSQAMGLRELALEVPRNEENLRLGPPIFEDAFARDGWIPVRAARRIADQQIVDAVPELVAHLSRPLGSQPLRLGYRPFVPTSLPVLVSERPSFAHLMIQGELGDPAVVVELVDKNGTRIPAHSGEIERTAVAEIPQTEILRVAVTMPEVQPGRYRLVWRVAGKESPARDILVLPRDTRERELYWTDLQGRAEGEISAASSEGSPAPADEETKIKAGEIARQYRQILAAWELPRAADKPPDPTRIRSQVAKLLQLEGKVLAGDRRRALGWLRNAEQGIAKEVIAWDPDGVIPLIHLHFEAYLVYRQRQNFALLTHSRMFVEQLVELYLQAAKNSEGAKRFAALALAGLALQAEEGNLASSGQRLYRRALALDPSSRAALLGLASSEHRQDHSAAAMEGLEQLIAHHAGLSEAHLRKAVLALRMGNVDQAAASFEKAASYEAPDWVASLIRQGRARVAIKAEALDEAAAQLPERPSQLAEIALAAFLADRQGEIRKGAALARGVPTTTDVSARLLFDLVPQGEQKILRESLAAAAEQRLGITLEWAAKNP